MEYTRKQTNNGRNEMRSSLKFSMFCTSRFSQIRGVARKNKNITRTLHLIGTSELFDSSTGHRCLPHDIKGAENWKGHVVKHNYGQLNKERPT